MRNTQAYKKTAKTLFISLCLGGLGVYGYALAAEDKANEKAHWSYQGQEGPAFWGSLSKKFALCRSGQRQSPVNLESRNSASLHALNFQYRPVDLNVLNNGHTLLVHYNRQKDSGGLLRVGDAEYKLLQFHFHTPSEHAKSGKRHAMEVHFVHQNSAGQLAVVGVFLNEGQHNPEFQKVLGHADRKAGGLKKVAGQQISAASLLPDSSHDYFHYNGSLTTPPCSEGVDWYVLKESIQVSPQQVATFRQLIGDNARPLQALGWRSIVKSN